MSDTYEIENDGAYYSNAGAVAELVACRAENKKLQSDNQKLLEVVRFYADKAWTFNSNGCEHFEHGLSKDEANEWSNIQRDDIEMVNIHLSDNFIIKLKAGKRARAVIKEIEGEGK